MPELNRVVAFRFDDPAGEVGIETLLVRADGGPLWQAPLTYRAAPVDGLEPWLLGTAEHSVLGTRWIYDGCADPVYASALASTILTGDGQAEEFLDIDGELQRREPSMRVNGSGSAAAPTVSALDGVVDEDPTVIVADSVELAVLRVLGGGESGGLTLTGTWDGQQAPLLLARAALRTS